MDLFRIFEEFFLNGIISKSMSYTFIMLVLKKDKSMKIPNHCPTTLVTIACKIITKVLSLRLSCLGRHNFIDQSAFVRGRQIMDAITLI